MSFWSIIVADSHNLRFGSTIGARHREDPFEDDKANSADLEISFSLGISVSIAAVMATEMVTCFLAG